MTEKDTLELRTELRTELKRYMNELASLAARFDGVDHAAARDINNARSNLFAAWSKIRSAPPELDYVGKPFEVTR